MPSSQKKSYGSIVQTRACRVLKGILEATKAGESSDPKKLQFRWQEEAGSQKVTIETTLQTLMHATNQDGQTKVTTPHVREALEAMRDFLEIMQDHRVKTKGEAQWNFTLSLWSQDIQRNLNEFDELWESKRSLKSKLQAVPEQTLKSGLKAGAPFPGVRLPENFVPRPEAFDPVKQRLLAADDRALVVSAIAGLGGLGKSVLAAALVLDAEVQMRFADGVLWVTLGQNPDLQNLLGDWICTLDKSRESYSATTLESASSYLQTLLIDKRMLLVVDDAWNGAHVEHFRVGGAACRVLVTTREAQIEEAEVHSLGLMTEAEAIALVRQKLDRQWQPEQEPEVKAFAKSLGYLPLALDLATNQVRDGLSWADLRSEFETERRSVALEVLDSSEAWDCLDENQQRKYSLRACFNLSLRRLNAEQLRQFAWLGVLPEDVSLDARMAVTLWELSPLKAKKALIDLRNRSFLTSGTETLEGEVTYRVHDLMHDTARGLIEQATLSPPIRTLADAHAQLLDRYRQKCDRWDRLPNDGYIHRHLTWHFQQAGREDEIHALMAMSDEQGRNAWFEACDRLGQPAIFVQDVKRGWAIAEQSYEEDNTRSIVLQCQYALIMATLNSLVANLPSELLAVAVKHEY
ncbi:NB-ARC domain-containing protein [Phormidesmis sp. 146-35]